MTMESLGRRIQSSRRWKSVDKQQPKPPQLSEWELEVSSISMELSADHSSSFQTNQILIKMSSKCPMGRSVEVKSAPTVWEASLKSPFQGFCFWDPPILTKWKDKIVLDQGRAKEKRVYG